MVSMDVSPTAVRSTTAEPLEITSYVMRNVSFSVLASHVPASPRRRSKAALASKAGGDPAPQTAGTTNKRLTSGNRCFLISDSVVAYGRVWDRITPKEMRCYFGRPSAFL